VDDKIISEIFLWNGSYYNYEVIKLNEVVLDREQRSVLFCYDGEKYILG